jgi:hypothetical protein
MMDWLNQKLGGDSSENSSASEPVALSPAAVAAIRRRFPMPKFFIFGYPRSGTTLLMRLIRLHPDVHCNRQAHLFTYPRGAAQALSDQEIQDWLERPSNRWTAGKQLEGSLIRLAGDFILESEAEALGKKVVGDKSPTVIGGLAVRRLHAIYPDARLIYMVRDGRDMAVSRRFQRFIDQPQHLTRADRRIRQGLAKNPELYSSTGKSIFTASDLQTEATDWGRNLEEIDREAQALFPNHYYCQKYEDLLAGPLEAMPKIWDFLQVPPSFRGDSALISEKMSKNPGAVEQARKQGDLVDKFKRGSTGGWQDWFTPTDRQIFNNAAGNTIVHWGYEENLSW